MNDKEAFVYCWTDKKTKKLYIGSHKGTLEDGYIASSKIFKEEYKNRPNDFVRQIIAIGNLSDIRALEFKLLESVNAAKNDMFYNKHNGGTKFYCSGHNEASRLKMSKTWKRKSKYNCIQKKAIEAWRGNKHSEESRNLMKTSQAKYSKQRSDYLKHNNPMKNKEVIKKMIETRKRNKELRNGSAR